MSDLPAELNPLNDPADEPHESRPGLVDYDDFQAEVQRLKRIWWPKILNSETLGRAPGRRPRDPEKERLLAYMDRVRLDRSHDGGTGHGGP